LLRKGRPDEESGRPCGQISNGFYQRSAPRLRTYFVISPQKSQPTINLLLTKHLSNKLDYCHAISLFSFAKERSKKTQ